MPHSGDPKVPERDILPEQIVEDDNGVMHVVPEALLAGPQPTGEALLAENDLAVENMENDWPCTDVSAGDGED